MLNIGSRGHVDRRSIRLPREMGKRMRALIRQIVMAYKQRPVTDVENVIQPLFLDLLQKHDLKVETADEKIKLKEFIRAECMIAVRQQISRKRSTSPRRQLVALAPDSDDKLSDGPSISHIIDDLAEVTTEEAAHYLRVSRTYLVKLIDNGVLPARKVGRYRRIAVGDMMDYREKTFRRAADACRNVARLALAEGSTRKRLNAKRAVDD